MPREHGFEAPAFPAGLQGAIAANRSSASANAWRAVEGQHAVSTLRLTANDPEAQDLLERVLDENKPAIPEDASKLHYLLAPPFRYPPPAHGSRFRASEDPGVLYAAMERRTACAEMGYWRWRFARASAAVEDIPASPQTLFAIGVRGESICVLEPPLCEAHSDWTHTTGYRATQELARAARDAGIDFIRYSSVRDPQAGDCIAVLRPPALRPRRPLESQTWHLTVTRRGVVWQRERERFVFQFAS